MTKTLEPIFLDENLAAVGSVMDVYDSLIWTERYFDVGDFEIKRGVAPVFVAQLDSVRYVYLPESDRLMLYETTDVQSDHINGNKHIIKGRSIELLLDRRIIWNRTVLTGSFQAGIEKLLNENAISPTDTNRTLSRLVFEASTDQRIIDLTIDAQFYGQSLYSAIANLCLGKKLGFKMTKRNDGKFVFKLYFGADRSYGQTENAFIVFKPQFDNLSTSEYIKTSLGLKTVNLVAGPISDTEVVTVTVEAAGGALTDINRREMFTDGSGVAASVPATTAPVTPPVVVTLTGTEYLDNLDERADQYIAQLTQRGTEELSKNISTLTFEGKINTDDDTYIYGRDFFMGDIVEILDEYGHQAKTQVTELIRSEDGAGTKLYPTFTAIPAEGA